YHLTAHELIFPIFCACICFQKFIVPSNVKFLIFFLSNLDMITSISFSRKSHALFDVAQPWLMDNRVKKVSSSPLRLILYIYAPTWMSFSIYWCLINASLK